MFMLHHENPVLCLHLVPSNENIRYNEEKVFDIVAISPPASTKGLRS
jgi:hypothetical protein